ncbi:MAG TPA: TRAP transporter small permease [Thalassobaculum sp.]
MQVIARILEKLAFAVLCVGGVGVLLSMFLGTADVVGTQVFGQPVPGAREITESTMVLIVFGALTYGQIRRSHIRVELLYMRLRPRAKAALDILADVCGLLFFGLLLWQGINEAQFSLQIGESTDGLIRFPLYPARITLALGTALFIVRLALDVVVDARHLIDGTEAVVPIDPLYADLLDDQNSAMPKIS